MCMKKIIFLLVFFLAVRFYAVCQTKFDIQVGNSYSFITSKSTLISTQRKITSIDKWQNGCVEKIPANGRVRIEAFDSEKVIYTYLVYDDVKQKDEYDLYNDSDPVFSMPINDFIQSVRPLYNALKDPVIGLYTIPFRFRGKSKTFDFESSLALQTNIVFGFGSRTKAESFLDVSVGVGLSSINLSVKNSNVSADRTASAITVSGGVLWKPTRFTNIGLFIGSDFLPSKDRNVNWIYAGKLWTGVGINISFNKVDTDRTSNTNKQ